MGAELMANERISVDKVNHVATLTLNRPEKHNAFDGVALQEFGQCMDELSKDEDTRVIIITGAGKSFCAGSDTAYISQIQADMGAAAGRFNFDEPFGPYQVLPSSLHNCPKPTIAAINGFASGIAVALISLCDYRIASENASFTPQFVNFGLAAEMGISYTLPRITSLSVALEFLSTGEKRDALWAKECGLVKEVTLPERLMESAMELVISWLVCRQCRWKTSSGSSIRPSIRALTHSFNSRLALERRWPRPKIVGKLSSP
jgi:enoyl-CoA hydratase/carnithine racemase